MSRKPLVVLGMSGGVDSSVAVHLLQQAGYEVHGVHMLMIPEKWQTNLQAVADAKTVAKQFGIKFSVLDIREKFEQIVIQQFIKEYNRGRTPNPCVLCNKQLKFGLFAEYAIKMRADYISTGHYVRTKISEYNQKLFYRAADPQKDQSYFLSLVSPQVVERCIFPLGEYHKEEVRDLARQLGLPVAEKKDSQEACFLEDKDYREFLKPYIKNVRKGSFILNGKVIGENKGIYNYTPGQRRGLEISYKEPLYVKSIDSKTGDVYLGVKKEVFFKGVALKDCQFFPDTPYMGKYTAKLRYRMKDENCLIERLPENKANLLFDNFQFAPAAGQTAAIYDGDIIIGSGVIDYTF